MYFSRSSEIVLLPVESIVPSLKQPRKNFDRRELEGLSNSIIENGLLQPITVRPLKNNEYEIVAGERRYRASVMAGITHIPSVIIESSDERSALLSLAENIQREDLNFFEEAFAVERLIKTYSYSVEYIASVLGKDPDGVSEMLKLLSFSCEQQKKMVENGLTLRHASALLRLTEKDDVDKALDEIIGKNLDVSETNELVDMICDEKSQSKKRKTRMFFKDLKLFINTLDHTVATMKRSGIEAQKDRFENDSYIKYTVTIPKTTHKL